MFIAHVFVALMFSLYYSDLKIIVLGASGVGKTCLLQRYISDTFSETEHVREYYLLIYHLFIAYNYTDHRCLLGNEKMGQS